MSGAVGTGPRDGGIDHYAPSRMRLGDLFHQAPPDAADVDVSALAYDDRQVGPGTVFFCVRGFTRDGHEFAGKAVAADCPYMVGSYTDYFVGSAAPEPGCEPPDVIDDPTPWLPGRPVIPGQPRVPGPEDFLDSVPPTRGEAVP